MIYDETSGDQCEFGLALGIDGNFYGVCKVDGANGDGYMYKITPSGTFTVLHNFNGTDGAAPEGALVQFTNGDFYGTTSGGGAYDYYGTVFKMTPTGYVNHALFVR